VVVQDERGAVPVTRKLDHIICHFGRLLKNGATPLGYPVAVTPADSAISPPDYLSPSSIGTFQQCALKFKFSRIDGIKEPPTRATLLGNFVHDVLEEMYKLPAVDRTKDSTRSIATEVFTKKDWAAQVMPYISGDQGILQFKKDAWLCIDNLWVIEDPAVTQPTGMEARVEGEIAGVKLKGFIDRYSKSADGTITISDYKTGKTPSPRFADQKFFQLQVYAGLVAHMGLGNPERLELLFLETATKFTKDVTADVLEQTAITVRTVRDSIESACAQGEFATTKSNLCDWCFFKPQCPAWAD
jgi:putative RecB family exonuclease